MSEDAYLDRMFDLAIASKQALDEHVELVRLRTDHAELQRKYTEALDVPVKQAGNTALLLRFALAGLTVPQLETVGYADNLWAEVTSALKEAEAAMQSAWYELESQKVPFAQFISQPDMDTKLTIVRQAIDHATQLKPIQGPAKIDPQPIKLTEAPDKLLAEGKEWNPEFWTAQGYVRNWAAVSNNPYFEVLRKEDKDLKLTSFVILCPTFLRRPLTITANGDYDLAWGSY